MKLKQTFIMLAGLVTLFSCGKDDADEQAKLFSQKDTGNYCFIDMDDESGSILFKLYSINAQYDNNTEDRLKYAKLISTEAYFRSSSDEDLNDQRSTYKNPEFQKVVERSYQNLVSALESKTCQVLTPEGGYHTRMGVCELGTHDEDRYDENGNKYQVKLTHLIIQDRGEDIERDGYYHSLFHVIHPQAKYDPNIVSDAQNWMNYFKSKKLCY